MTETGSSSTDSSPSGDLRPDVRGSPVGLLSVLGFVNVILRNLGLVAVVLFATLTVALILHVLEPDLYRADSQFVPNVADTGGSRFRGLAAEFGLDVGGEGGESIFFYAKLLRSRDLLKQAVLREYSTRDPEAGEVRTANLLERLEVEPSLDEETRVRVAIDRLTARLTVQPDQESGIIRLSTVAETPELAEELNAALLMLVNRFNLERRQSRAAAEREFVEARLEEARQELAEAEERMRVFLDQNRQYENSPQLQFQAAQLERRIGFRQQVFSSLAQSYEQARIEEVRNTPVITVMDMPEGSARRVGRGLTVTLVLALLLGGMLAVGAALGREHFRRERSEMPEKYDEFRRLQKRIPLVHRLRRSNW